MRLLGPVAVSALVLSLALGAAVPGRAGDSNKPSIDLIPESFFSVGGDNIGTPGNGTIDGQIRLGGKLTVPLGHKFSFQFDHSYDLRTLGRVTKLVTVGSGKNKAQYPYYDYDGSRYDAIEDFSFNYQASRTTSFQVDYYYKHRVCCPAAGDPTNAKPDTEHLAYFGGTTHFGGNTVAGRVFTFDANLWHSINHQPSASAAFPNLGQLWLYSTSITGTEPIDAKSRFFGYVGASISNDYYNNYPIPYYFHTIKAGIIKEFTPDVTLQVNLSNLTQFNQGYPFQFPNETHFTNLTMRLDYHIEPFGK